MKPTKLKQPRLNSVGAFCLSVTLACGCSQHHVAQKQNDPLLEPKIEKDKIVFLENAPQLSYLKTEAVQARKSVASGLSGRLAWNDDITARVFSPVSGRISEIVVNPGQSVVAGDPIAWLKSPDFGQAQSDARKALADIKVAERALNRNRELFEHGAAAQKEVESAEADYARALSEKERALATLAGYGADTNSISLSVVDGRFALKAPVSGVVVEKSVNPGQEVRSDQVSDKPLFVISDPTRLWLFLDVAEADVASLKPELEVLIHARALPDRIFQGHLEVISEGLDASTRTIKARCVVNNPEKLLRAEMYVTAEIRNAASGVDVATKAVFSKDDEHFVFVETANGSFEKRHVKVGLESNGRSVVLDGLATGEKVVVEGSLLLESILEGENT